MADGLYPESAYILSLLGGIFVLIGGIILSLVLIGILGVIFGALMIYFAVNLKSNPGNRTVAGVVIIVFSVLSWITSIGGLVIGFFLGLIGGILALTWTPPNTVAGTTQPALQQNDRICPACSSVIPSDSAFCPTCGSQL